MSNQHKHPTISFRISDAERKQIEARILASGMMKKITLSVPASITASALSARKKLYIRLCRLLMLCICNYLKCRKHLPHQTALPILFLRQKPLRTYISNTLICLQLLSTCWMVQNICGKETVMNNNLNFLFGMYEPATDSIIANIDENTILVIRCKECNSSVIFDDPNDVVYLYRLAMETPLLYARFALKENGLQNYEDAMNWFNY